MSLFHLIHRAVLVSALLQWLLALVWYSPLFFGGLWKSAIDLPDQNKKARTIRAIIASGIVSLAVSFILMHVIWWLGVFGLRRGAYLGFVLWAGFIFAPMFAQYIHEGRSFKLFAISAGYWMFALVGGGALMARW